MGWMRGFDSCQGSLPLFLFHGFFTSSQVKKEDVIDFDLTGKQSGVMRNRDMHAGRTGARV